MYVWRQVYIEVLTNKHLFIQYSDLLTQLFYLHNMSWSEFPAMSILRQHVNLIADTSSLPVRVEETRIFHLRIIHIFQMEIFLLKYKNNSQASTWNCL